MPGFSDKHKVHSLFIVSSSSSTQGLLIVIGNPMRNAYLGIRTGLLFILPKMLTLLVAFTSPDVPVLQCLSKVRVMLVG